MAKRNVDVDLSESSVYGKNAEEGAEEMEPVADGIDGRIDDQETGGVGLDPSLDEEIDALKLDLTQEDDLPGRDGSGRVVDDVAEERLAEFTEVGRDLEDEGAESEVP